MARRLQSARSANLANVDRHSVDLDGRHDPLAARADHATHLSSALRAVAHQNNGGSRALVYKRRLLFCAKKF